MTVLAQVGTAGEFEHYMNPFSGGGSIDVGQDGSVWFSCGLYLVQFDPQSEELNLFSLPSTWGTAHVAVDTAGAAWVHCSSSICRVWEGQQEFFLFPGAYGYLLEASPDGTVWALISGYTPPDGPRQGLLASFTKDGWEEVPRPATCSVVMGFCFDFDGAAWASFFLPRPVDSWSLGHLRDGQWDFFPLAGIDIWIEQGDPMVVRSPGELWIGANQYVSPPTECVYVFQDGRLAQTYRYPEDGLAGNHPTDIAVDREGRVWMPDMELGVSLFDGENWTVFNTLNSGLPSNFVNGVAAAPDDSVWFTTSAGLASYHNGLWGAYTGGESTVMNNNICSVAVDNLGRTFYGTYFGQVGYFDGARWKELYNPGTTCCDEVYDIAFGPDGTVWLACQTFLRAWKGAMINYQRAGDTGMSLNASTNLCLDQDDNLWVCAAQGLAKYDGDSWKSFQAFTDSDPPLAITPEGLACDQQGRIWVGTRIGVAAIKDDQLDQFLPQYEYVHTIECDKDGMLWLGFGASERGVLQFDGENEVAWYTMDDGLPSNRINSIECDAANNIWVGTDDGLAYFDGDQWTMWDIDSGLPVNEIRDISMAPNGDVWFATPSGLLCHESGAQPLLPSITIGTDSKEYHAGDTMTVTLTYENPGPDIDIDIQIGCLLPDGTLFYYPGGDLPVPFMSGMLPSGTMMPTVLVLIYELPEGFPTGDYVWMAAFFEQGTFNMIGDISTAPFTFM